MGERPHLCPCQYCNRILKMIYKESLTYYVSVTLMDGEWRAHCEIEISSPSEYDNESSYDFLNIASIFGPADALRQMADEIEIWENKNIELYKSAQPE